MDVLFPCSGMSFIFSIHSLWFYSIEIELFMRVIKIFSKNEHIKPVTFGFNSPLMKKAAMKTTNNSNKVLTLIREGKNRKAFAILYRNLPHIQRMILTRGGSKADADDIFQEALLVFHKKAMNPEFELNCAEGTYLYSVCRFLWKDELLRRNRISDAEKISVEQDVADIEIQVREEKYDLAEKALASLGDK